MELAERDLTGQVVDGRFRVEAKLGSGGMGTVWRVEHVVSLQRFALKTLDPRFAEQEEATRRFLREARAAAALRTRHVVRVVDAQMQHRHGGEPLPFLVMELLEGQNLQQLLDERRRLEPGELIWMSSQLGRALDAAHRQGIVHRDLKPSNVFIAEDEEGQPIVKLCDFGIAKLTGDSGDLATDPEMATRTGALLGTPMYLAPELLRGAGAAVPATDQWSMGLIAFRAMAGVEYFAHVRGFSDLVLTIANDPLVPPSKRASGLPRAFDGWFLRSCARRPEERFADVPAQVASLEAALGRPVLRPIAIRQGEAPVPTVASADTDARPGVATRIAGPRGARASRRALYLAGALVWAVAALAALGWLGRRGQPPAHATAGTSATDRTPLPDPLPAPRGEGIGTTSATDRTPLPDPLPAARGEGNGSASATDRTPLPNPLPAARGEGNGSASATDRTPLPNPLPAPRGEGNGSARGEGNGSARGEGNGSARGEGNGSAALAAPSHKRRHNTASRHAAPSVAPGPSLLPRGAACRRSAECASSLCAAETCL